MPIKQDLLKELVQFSALEIQEIASISPSSDSQAKEYAETAKHLLEIIKTKRELFQFYKDYKTAMTAKYDSNENLDEHVRAELAKKIVDSVSLKTILNYWDADCFKVGTEANEPGKYALLRYNLKLVANQINDVSSGLDNAKSSSTASSLDGVKLKKSTTQPTHYIICVNTSDAMKEHWQDVIQASILLKNNFKNPKHQESNLGDEPDVLSVLTFSDSTTDYFIKPKSPVNFPGVPPSPCGTANTSAFFGNLQRIVERQRQLDANYKIEVLLLTTPEILSAYCRDTVRNMIELKRDCVPPKPELNLTIALGYANEHSKAGVASYQQSFRDLPGVAIVEVNRNQNTNSNILQSLSNSSTPLQLKANSYKDVVQAYWEQAQHSKIKFKQDSEENSQLAESLIALSMFAPQDSSSIAPSTSNAAKKPGLGD